MKNVLVIVSTILMVQMAGAQVKEGKITYEQKIDMYRRIPEDNQQLRSMIAPFRTSKFELYFTNNQSLFKAAEEEPDMTEQNNGGVVIRIGNSPDNVSYKNFTTQRSVEVRELMDELYLIDDSLHSIPWKLEESETKNILGYTCKKATGKTARGTDVVAWYSEEIPVASGPDQFTGLPGMVLGLDANKSEIVFTAISIDKKVDAKLVKAPTKGKKMTGPEFAAKQKEVFGNQPGGMRVVTN